ncbi:hypothetical protein TorRG33x02_315340 [Trema orientale]|uniref:Transmembrane protein n=1 Tax=Trema orientale TaxID=63057 RepID=A0A2P5BN34_TREOI|nr:hypothetical protein TorRG33x02_315340 [Trema orientale]
MLPLRQSTSKADLTRAPYATYDITPIRMTPRVPQNIKSSPQLANLVPPLARERERQGERVCFSVRRFCVFRRSLRSEFPSTLVSFSGAEFILLCIISRSTPVSVVVSGETLRFYAWHLLITGSESLLVCVLTVGALWLGVLALGRDF